MTAQFWNCTNAEYHGSLTEDSHSSVDLFIDSVEEYAAKRVFRTCPYPPPTPEMEFGTLFHTTILEPHLLDEEYIEAEKFDKRTTDGKQGFADFCARAGKRKAVTGADLAMAKDMFEGVMRNKEARRIIEADGKCECSIKSIDPDSGVPLKVRTDRLNNNGEIGDLKTTQHVNPESWAKTTHNFGYHRQAALYLDVLKELGVSGPMHFIAVSKTPPHECVVYHLGFNTLNLGRSQNKAALFELSYRRREKLWTGRYSGSSHEIEVPHYAFPRN